MHLDPQKSFYLCFLPFFNLRRAEQAEEAVRPAVEAHSGGGPTGDDSCKAPTGPALGAPAEGLGLAGAAACRAGRLPARAV